jgi:hypothetical protein
MRRLRSNAALGYTATIMRTLFVAIALLFSLACFSSLVLFMVVKLLPSYEDGGLAQLHQDLVWQAWLFMGLLTLLGTVFLAAGISLLAQNSNAAA